MESEWGAEGSEDVDIRRTTERRRRHPIPIAAF